METAGREGSAALATSLDGDRTRLEILARTSLRAEEEHASLLVPRIQALMEEVGADGSELSGIVVGAGPGSFTGVRVAAATAKGFARALNLPLWAFSSLAAAAVNGESPGWTVAEEGGAGAGGRDPGAETVGGRAEGAIAFRGMRSTGGSPFDALRPRCVLFDARGDRVYLAAYRLDGGRLATLLEPRAATVREVMEEQLLPPGSLLLGDGALRHRAILEEAGHPVLPPPFGQPSAVGLIHLLSYDPDAAPLEDPGRWEPEYLRASGAERMWKTRKGMGL
jgi:tRNA threonylcarbamoyl adenosine modification protein YeaZ